MKKAWCNSPAMHWLARVLRSTAKLRFKLLRLATIKDIPTETFNQLMEEFKADGWRVTSEYSGIDAWIDYGCVHLRRGRSTLRFEWDNWTEGSVEGPRQLIEEIANRHRFTVTHEWRWSEYDEKSGPV